MKTNSKDPHGQGFREVSIVQDIPPLEIIYDRPREQIILELLQTHTEIAAYQVTKRLSCSAGTAYHTLKRMEDKGLLKSRAVEARINGKRKLVTAFSLK